MAAHVQGVLTRAAATAAALLLAGCAGAPARRPLPGSTPPVWPPAGPAGEAPARVAVVQEPQPVRPVQGYGPEVLLPDPKSPDAEVARVGDLSLRQSQAFARLLDAEPKLALYAVDLLVYDVLVAQHARQYGIQVDAARVRELADREESQLLRRVQSELGGQVEFADYVWRIFGMRLADWQRAAELRIAQRLYHGYVIRYLALREDRVVVRYIVHKDRQVLEDAARKVREGADFATLALRLSEDELRRDGGLLPPFGEGFPHPVAEAALKLQPGELSPVFEKSARGSARFYLVYCLERLAGREAAFADVRAEIDRELEQKPLTPIETNAYTLRWRGALEAKTDDKSGAGR
ncbi:MAG: peptidylprolyl isomerase [Planctomycetota bacterium]